MWLTSKAKAQQIQFVQNLVQLCCSTGNVNDKSLVCVLALKSDFYFLPPHHTPLAAFRRRRSLEKK